MSAHTPESGLRDYWLSWYADAPLSEFELHSPWWISGYAGDSNVMVAAVRAESEEAAFEQVKAAYDNGPGRFSERFCEPLTVSPFSGRFPQSSWMAWDAERTCGCDRHRVIPPAPTKGDDEPDFPSEVARALMDDERADR